jgi:hypothetical protein
VLLVALALLALTQLAPKADGRELGTTLARSVTGVGHKSRSQSEFSSTHPAPDALRVWPGGRAAVRRTLPRLPGPLRGARRGARALWRRAWFACLAYARARYALRHPEISVPGYTLPYGTALRMIDSCVSPIDLLHDLPELGASP